MTVARRQEGMARVADQQSQAAQSFTLRPQVGIQRLDHLTPLAPLPAAVSVPR
jgi:hypothetical protein